jgi:hypothetical protein
MVDSRLDLELQEDLDSWLSTHAALYAAGEAPAATDSEKRVKNLITLYAQWFCAFEVVSRFLLVPQIVSDGKNQINRFSKIDLQVAQNNAAARMQRYRTALDETVNSAASAIAGVSIMAVSIPDYDPVTNV